MFDARPEAFGSYRVLEELRAGPFGPVYRAQDVSGVIPVVIKVFDQDLSLEQARAVAAALERLSRMPLDHPAIVPVIGAGVEGSTVWLAEPWAHAAPLDEAIARYGAQTLGDSILRITRIAGALDFAAAIGIHHGALHPRDILVSEDSTLLTGLGVLQALEEAGLEVPMGGPYVSPQRASGEPPGGRDDTYALAAVTYELVYGSPPAATRVRATMTRLTGVDQSRFADVIEGALSRDPDERPSTALEFAAALQQVLVENVEAPAPAARGTAAVEPPARIEPPSIAEEFPIREVTPLRDAPSIREVPPMREVPSIREVSATREAPVRDLPLRTDAARAAAVRPTPPPGFLTPPPAAAPRSGVWSAIAAGVAVGILTGFAAGFVVGQRDETPIPRSAERAVSRSARPDDQPTPTAGRDYTESSVPSPPVAQKPVAPPRPDADNGTGASERRTGTGIGSGSGTGTATRTGTGTGTATGPASATGTRSGSGSGTGTGSLDVDSRPRGATVFIDGRLVGKTPLLLSNVQPGSHAVRIDLAGHRRWVAAVSVAPGSRQRVAASLER